MNKQLKQLICGLLESAYETNMAEAEVLEADIPVEERDYWVEELDEWLQETREALIEGKDIKCT